MKAKSLVLMSVAAVLLLACMEKKNDQLALQNKIDSLIYLVETNQILTETFNEAETLLDSMDKSRNILRNRLWEGTSYEDFTYRMKELNSYVKRSESKVKDLETALKASKLSGSSYSARIQSLKDELSNSTSELASLQEQVAKYRDENDSLIKTVNLQQAEIEDKLSMIAVKESEVAQLEGRINEILIQAKQDEAEAYYARGEVYEQLAIRTNFAPRKRKAAQQSALDMYQMAVLYGKQEAQSKVDELQKKVSKS
jgi:chromosome segregation ATPase